MFYFVNLVHINSWMHLFMVNLLVMLVSILDGSPISNISTFLVTTIQPRVSLTSIKHDIVYLSGIRNMRAATVKSNHIKGQVSEMRRLKDKICQQLMTCIYLVVKHNKHLITIAPP